MIDIKWVGLLTVAFKNNEGSISGSIVLKHIDIGLGADGLIHWQENTNDKEVDVDDYNNKIETIDETKPSPIVPDPKTKDLIAEEPN